MIYAIFNKDGNAEFTSNIVFDHAVEIPGMDELSVHANDLYYDGEKVVKREMITITLPDGNYMVGQPLPLEGVPEDAVILANGQPITLPYTPLEAGRVVLDVVGAYRASWPLTVQIDNQETLWARVREKRDTMLKATDWVMLQDSPVSEEKRQEYIVFRKALRDLPIEQAGATLESIVWPNLPE